MVAKPPPYMEMMMDGEGDDRGERSRGCAELVNGKEEEEQMAPTDEEDRVGRLCDRGSRRVEAQKKRPAMLRMLRRPTKPTAAGGGDVAGGRRSWIMGAA